VTPSDGACNRPRERQDAHVVPCTTLGASSRPYKRAISAPSRWGTPHALVKLRGGQKPSQPGPLVYCRVVRPLASPQCGGTSGGRGSGRGQ
jgi:hypothetical protein